MLGFAHVSAGDLLRRHNDPHIHHLLKEGMLVPQQVIFQVMKDHLARLVDEGADGVIVDGFPRSAPQAKGWLKRSGMQAPDLAVHFNLPEPILIGKLLGREMCGGCGDTYNTFGLEDGEYHLPAMNPKVPGVCDACGGNLMRRADDTPNTVRNRLKTHHEEESDLLGFLASELSAANIKHVTMKRGVADVKNLVDSVRQKLALYVTLLSWYGTVSKW